MYKKILSLLVVLFHSSGCATVNMMNQPRGHEGLFDERKIHRQHNTPDGSVFLVIVGCAVCLAGKAISYAAENEEKNNPEWGIEESSKANLLVAGFLLCGLGIIYLGVVDKKMAPHSHFSDTPTSNGWITKRWQPPHISFPPLQPGL